MKLSFGHASVCATLLTLGVLGANVASAANELTDFTQNPTAFISDANWDSFSSTATSFTGTFSANTGATGTDIIAIVDENTAELLDTITLNFSSSNNGGAAEETFGASVVAGIDSGTAPAGDIVELATGSSVDYTADVANLPSNITLQEKEDSPSAAAPEPASLFMGGLGLAGLALAGIRRKLKA